MAIEEGKKAPAFTLPDENDDKIKLADLTGQWVVLYFYPRDDTPGCTCLLYTSPSPRDRG